MEKLRRQSGFILLDLLITIILLSTITMIMIPKIKVEKSEIVMSTLERSFIMDYYYALNLSMTESKVIKLVFDQNSHRYIVMNTDGEVYKIVSYDACIRVDLNLQYGSVKIINGYPISEDFVRFTCRTKTIALTIYKDGLIIHEY